MKLLEIALIIFMLCQIEVYVTFNCLEVMFL
jgi:hypothetical protein